MRWFESSYPCHFLYMGSCGVCRSFFVCKNDFWIEKDFRICYHRIKGCTKEYSYEDKNSDASSAVLGRGGVCCARYARRHICGAQSAEWVDAYGRTARSGCCRYAAYRREDGDSGSSACTGPAHAYMEESSLPALRGMAGVAQAAPQFFLASAHAGCCSTEVQIIGFDPTADFTIQPWLRERSADALAFGDAIVGSGVSVHADTGLMLYNTPCRVVGRLMPTGTAMDTTVYVNMDTVQTMAANAAALHTEHTGAAAPAHGISAVLIRVADGFSPEGVAAAINEACPELSVRAANGMVHAAAEELGSFNGMIGALAVCIWLLGMLALGLLYRGIKRDA